MTATSATVRDAAAQAYLAGVAAELADLPDEERADLLDETAALLDELVAEGGAPLTNRLGDPASYAAELRASAGLAPAAARAGRLGSIRARWRGLRSGPALVAVSGVLGSMRPLWWVLRAWVVVGLVAMFPGQTTPTWSGVLLVGPRVSDGDVGLLVLMLAIVGSVHLGRRDVSRQLFVRRGVLALNVVAAAALLPVLGSFSDAARSPYFGGDRAVCLADEGVSAAGEPA